MLKDFSTVEVQYLSHLDIFIKYYRKLNGMFPSHKSKFSGGVLQHLKVFGQLYEEVKISTSCKKILCLSKLFFKLFFFYSAWKLYISTQYGHLFLHFYCSRGGKMKERGSRENVISDPREMFCQS